MASANRLCLGAPFPVWTGNNVPGFLNTLLNANDDALEIMATMPEAAMLTHVLYRHGVTTGTPPEFKITIQAVDGAGLPTTPVHAQALFTPPVGTSWDGTIRRIALDSAYAASRGERFMIVIARNAGLIDGTNNCTFTSTTVDLSPENYCYGYAISNNSGVRTRVNGGIWGVASATKVYGFPIKDIGSVTYSSNSTPDEYALAFNLSTALGATYKVAGIRAHIDNAAIGKTVLITLYNGTTPLQTVTFDTDHVRTASVNGNILEIFFDETDLSVLNMGSTYRVGLAPQETAASLVLFTIQLAEAGDRSAFDGNDQFWLSTRTDGGGAAWTDVTTERPLMELILEDITPAPGSVGGIGSDASGLRIGLLRA